MKQLTVKDIRARFNKEKPNFIGMKNDKGQWAVPINSPQIKAEQRMKQIEAYFAKESSPDGIYYVITRDSLHANAPEIETPIVKGNVSLQATERPAQTIQTVKTESVWDVNTAVDKLSEINRLSFENAWLRKENDELRGLVKDLQDKAQPEKPEEDGMKSMMSGLKDLIELAAPVVDKHFALRERDLNLRERMAIGSRMPTMRRLPQEERADGGVPVNDPNYEEYFATVVERGTDDQVNHECDYLEEVNPALYQELAAKYGIDDNAGADEPQQSQDGTTG